MAVALDASGNVYVADSGNDAVKEILAASDYKTVKTLGPRFLNPRGVALDANGDVFVGEYGNRAVKEMLAVNGSVPASPTINAFGGFVSPKGVAVDSNGNVYVADWGKNSVAEIVAVGGSVAKSATIRTLASGLTGTTSVAVDSSGNVYATNDGDPSVREIVAVGGSIPVFSPSIEAIGNFTSPRGVAVDGNGNLFVADQDTGKVSELALQSVNLGSKAVGSLSQTLSLPFIVGSKNATKIGSIALLTTGISGLDFQNTGGSCAAIDYTSATRCEVDVRFAPRAPGQRLGAVVFYSGANKTGSVLATLPLFGLGTGPQAAYGPGGAQSQVGNNYISPAGVAVDAGGNVYVSDLALQEVVKIAPNGTQTPVGSGLEVPEAVAVDGAGNVYIADSQASRVFKVTPAGMQTQIGSGFSFPAGIAVDGAGNVFVSDPFVVAVFKISPNGGQTTVGGGYNTPGGVAVDSAGDVYVADAYNAAVYKITPAGKQSTVGGSHFVAPTAVAVDAAGDVYIADGGANAIYEVTPAGSQSTLASGFNVLDGIAADASGDLFVADADSSKVLKIDRRDAPALAFEKTQRGAISKDSPRSVEVENIGNAPLKFSALTYPTDFPAGHSLDAEDCTANTTLAAASNCVLTILFKPIAAVGGSNTANLKEEVEFATDALNTPKSQAAISLSGTETAP